MNSSLIIIDTSIFLNILGVPSKSQDKKNIRESLETYIRSDASLILPMATILETGNHIAQNGDGNIRRKIADKFCVEIHKAINNEAPYKVSSFPSNEEVKSWIDKFPNLAMANKSPTKQEGTSFGDLTIIQEFEKQKLLHKNYEIWIWSLDGDLEQYRYTPNS